MGPLDTIQTYLRYGDLLVVWADMPWQPITSLPTARAVAIGRMRGEVRTLEPIVWPLSTLPPLSILSLDPSGRLAQAYRQASKPLNLVRTQADVPVRGQHNLLQLGGDLGRRQGLLLTWEDVAALRTGSDKRYLLDEAARICRFGAVLLLDPYGNEGFARVWQTIAPALGDSPTYALGPGPWPNGIEPLAESPQGIFDALRQVEPKQMVGSETEVESLKAQRAQHLRRLLKLQEQAALRPAAVDLQLQIEDEQRAIRALENRLDALAGERAP